MICSYFSCNEKISIAPAVKPGLINEMVLCAGVKIIIDVKTCLPAHWLNSNCV